MAWAEPAIESIRANCLVSHENAPSNPQQPSMGVFKTNFAYEALSMDHFFLRGVGYLGIADRHSGMLSVHSTRHKGANEVKRILREHCARQGIPQIIFTDGFLIFVHRK